MSSSFFHTRGSLVHDERSTKKDRLGRNDVLIFEFFNFPGLVKVLVCMSSRPICGRSGKTNAFPLAVFVRHANFDIP